MCERATCPGGESILPAKGEPGDRVRSGDEQSNLMIPSPFKLTPPGLHRSLQGWPRALSTAMSRGRVAHKVTADAADRPPSTASRIAKAVPGARASRWTRVPALVTEVSTACCKASVILSWREGGDPRTLYPGRHSCHFWQLGNPAPTCVPEDAVCTPRAAATRRVSPSCRRRSIATAPPPAPAPLPNFSR